MRTLGWVFTKTNDKAGDGTTTATVLAQAIVREGLKRVAAGMNPMDLKRGIDTAAKEVAGDLLNKASKIKKSSEIAQVGTISANGASDIGEMIAEAMGKVGNGVFEMASDLNKEWDEFGWMGDLSRETGLPVTFAALQSIAKDISLDELYDHLVG